jgi:hypothetical protein
VKPNTELSAAFPAALSSIAKQDRQLGGRILYIADGYHLDGGEE